MALLIIIAAAAVGASCKPSTKSTPRAVLNPTPHPKRDLGRDQVVPSNVILKLIIAVISDFYRQCSSMDMVEDDRKIAVGSDFDTGKGRLSEHSRQDNRRYQPT